MIRASWQRTWRVEIGADRLFVTAAPEDSRILLISDSAQGEAARYCPRQSGQDEIALRDGRRLLLRRVTVPRLERVLVEDTRELAHLWVRAWGPRIDITLDRAFDALAQSEASSLLLACVVVLAQSLTWGPVA